VQVRASRCGERVIAPALQLTADRLARARLAGARPAPPGQHAAARLLLSQADLLWRRHIIDYLLLRAIRP
jgi:hypothetical protein